jgi:hypothetical protein
MEAAEVIRQIEQQAIVALDAEDLSPLLEASVTLRAHDTCLAGWIRILSLEGHVLVQEQTLDGEVLIHRLGTLEAAELFVEHRLNAYERMWDGCGCKIDYRQQPERL